MSKAVSPFSLSIPQQAKQPYLWAATRGSSAGLAIAEAAQKHKGLILLAVEDMAKATQLEQQIRFFLANADYPILHFPDWETLPYDVFSPLPELISQRLLALHELQKLQKGLLIAPVATLLHRVAPPEYLAAHALLLDTGDKLDLDEFRTRLEAAGYQCVSQVMEHGEFAVRGGLLDLFPMGSKTPFRIDLFDDEIDTIRLFDTETQRSTEKIDKIQLLPAREFGLDKTTIERFRKNYRLKFEGDPTQSLIYREVSDATPPGGIEYYLPLFHETVVSLFDYLPKGTLLIQQENAIDAVQGFVDEAYARYEQRRYDIERPVLPPDELFLTTADYKARLTTLPRIDLRTTEAPPETKGYGLMQNFDLATLPTVSIQARAVHPAGKIQDFIAGSDDRILFVAESAGRREHLRDTLRDFEISTTQVESWADFLAQKDSPCICTAPIDAGLRLLEPKISLIPETLLFGEKIKQERRRRKAGPDADAVVRNLAELREGAPVVHEEHGVGRYLGLQVLDVGGQQHEFLTLEYAKGDKLYVPVASLHKIGRYTGAQEENAPLHRLGSDQWEKAKKKAAEKIRDVAAELLDIYARREAKPGYAYPNPAEEYAQFSASFPFEETPDQQAAIDAIVGDLTSKRPTDRVVCGDVGFGKTEVAMRAAFVAANAGKQVAVLVPTTLLANQHYQNFLDRFADWPIKIESLSRFRTAKESKGVLKGLAEGVVDIVVGTHKLLSQDIKFKNLGLCIIDEEHRFGVRHKERMKSLRSEVDVLTLTATPIPRTLNMAMSGMRDLSIIATPPVDRHPIKTFVNQWNDTLITEAILREIKRGGQVYFLHNEVDTIENMADKLATLVPDARVQAAHGQMPEKELERIMRDFYHQRFNLLVATTIIESGIDVPSANTMIINKADRLGLAQLHQLRGRVGRSHHRAYCYLITPPPKTLTPDASKRLQAIESLEDLGAGFTLATHDLEIRGAGELLGDEQSGQINEIGYTLYTEMLHKAVAAIKAGRSPELDRPLDHGTEVDLQLPARLPEDYLPDVHQRLIQYKRIASAKTEEELKELKVEMIDRFGLLPDSSKYLFDVTGLKLTAQPLRIKKIEAGPAGGRILFDEEPNIDPARVIQLIQKQPDRYRLDGADKMKFNLDLSAPETRVEKVALILRNIALN